MFRSILPTFVRDLRLATLLVALGFLLIPQVASARINLGNFGGGSPGRILEPWDPTQPPVGPGGGGGGPNLGTVAALEAAGYVCTKGGVSAIDCRSCSVEPYSETQTCEVRLCTNSSSCNSGVKRRYDIPGEVDTNNYGYWAKEFAWDASYYFIADFDGDGRNDLGAQVGAQVKVALSRGTHFQDIGVWTGSVPAPSPGASTDVNRDGYLDQLSVSADGHLVVAVGSGSGIVSTIDMPNVFCAGIGECHIGDVNADGFPDLIEVMRGAIGLDRAGDVWVSLGSELPGFPTLPPAPPATDTDADGVADREDVCIETPDASQLDADADGYGNACDADLDNDLVVDEADRLAWISCYFAGLSVRPNCAIADFNGDGAVTIEEYYDPLMASMGNPPGPSAIDTPPQIELFSPVDGTILNVSSTHAWVAGWVANVPEGDVDVTVNGIPVQLVGPDNYFSSFVSLAQPVTDFSLFRPVVVDAIRGDKQDVERRVVLQGDRVKPGFRANGALGARLSAEGLQRIEQYLRESVATKIHTELPGKVNGYRARYDCVDYSPIPICWDGVTISNAAVSMPTLSVAFEGDTIHMHASIAQLTFNWEVHVDGPNCGDSALIQNIEVDLHYRPEVTPGGVVEMRELHEPVIDADFDLDGCWGGGQGSIEDGVIDGINGFVNDPDDVEGTTLRGPQTGAAGKAVEDVFRSFDVSGTIDIVDGPAFPNEIEQTESRSIGSFAGPILGTTTYTVAYDARFESAVQDSTGITVWLSAGADVVDPPDGLGGPDGAFQIPFATTPVLPTRTPGDDPYHVAAAITPNGLNEALDALARSGYMQTQAIVVDEADVFGNGVPLPITAGVLRTLIPEFVAYPGNEPIRVYVFPSSLAPVVSGRRGPGLEPLDVQVPQLGIQFLDASDGVALELRVDARVGVDVVLASGGSGSLTATARKVQLLDYAVVNNAIGADPAVVYEKLLCVDADENDAFGCAISDLLAEGLDTVIGTLPLPSLESETDTEEGFELVPKCLDRLFDGTLVAEFGLLIPGEEPLGGIHGGISNQFACNPPILTQDGDLEPGPIVGPVIDPGTLGGVLETAPTRPAVNTSGTISTGTLTTRR